MNIFRLTNGIIVIFVPIIFYLNITKEVYMENKDPGHVDSILKVLTGFNLKEFALIVIVAYMSILTTPGFIATMGMAAQPMVIIIAVMLVQYSTLYYVAKIHGSGILKTMTSNGFVGWLMWFALVCMLILPVIHLLSLFGLT